jgi:phosphoribosylformimino-5-aminoimidazole carboxamide ribotide isomerase
VVAGLETLAGPGALREGMVFSLDLRGGHPLGGPGWPACPRAIVREAVWHGARSILALDLARVGMGRGTGTEEMLAWLREEYPTLEILAGGGVAGPAELERLEALGVNGVLVGSALHDGRLGPVELGRFVPEGEGLRGDGSQRAR